MRFLILVLLFANVASADVPDFLQRFAKDPRTASYEIPKKSKVYLSKFSKEEISDRNFVVAKDKGRDLFCNQTKGGEPCFPGGGFRPFAELDDDFVLRAFMDGDISRDIYELDQLRDGESSVMPWSGHYWPTYQGGIGARYAEPEFPASSDFKENHTYFEKNYFNIADYSEDRLNKLSPGEKFDLVVGDDKWSLTSRAWREGLAYYERDGKVETWMGICHGWAPAAIAVPRPVRAFDVEIPNLGKKIKFYPDDVRGLVSQLWANAHLPNRFLGGRCNDKNPKTDRNGRILSKDCFDLNPATWHLALLNLVGKNKQSFVFDATYDYEVWNQPLAGYSFRYFNPITSVSAEDIRGAIVPRSEYKRDPYKKYRSDKAKQIVGIEMTLYYVVEDGAFHYDLENAPEDAVTSVTYYYDLELDENNMIIGGEWYQLAHPDMAWRIEPGVRAMSYYDYQVDGIWGGLLPLPFDVAAYAKLASKQGQPMAYILDKLVELASGVQQ